MEPNKVVVGVDGSEGSADALRWAVVVGQSRGWKVEAVLAWGYLDQHHAEADAPFDPDYDEARAREALARYVEDALGEAAPSVDLRATLDLPARGLLEAADEAALLVVGARGLGGFKGLLLGSVSQHCLHHADGPVAVVHHVSPRPALPSRVVVAVDGSANSVEAIRWGAEHAAASGARLQVVHAWHPPYIGGEPFAFSPATRDDCETAARLVLDEAIDQAGIAGLDVEPEPVLVEGAAARATIEASDGAAMVVVGARGLGGFAGLLLGSVSNQVARHASCPVVVIPAAPR